MTTIRQASENGGFFVVPLSTNGLRRMGSGVTRKNLVTPLIFKGLQCKKTSYNTIGGKHTLGGTPYRKNYAGIGDTYDESKDAFISPKPKEFDSWTLNEDTCQWTAPVEYPNDDKIYSWDEENLQWVESNQIEIP